MRHTTLALLVMLATELGSDAFAQAPAARDSAVYRSVLDSLYPRTQFYLIRQFYRPVDPVDSPPAFGSQPAVPEALQARLASAINVSGGSLEALLRTWRNAEWIDSSDVVVPTKDGGGIIRFAVTLSRIAYTADFCGAVLYVRLQCGGLCGSERVVQVALGSDGRWRIAHLATTAVF